MNNKKTLLKFKLKRYIIWNGKNIELLKVNDINYEDDDVIDVEEIYFLKDGELITPNYKVGVTNGLVISELEDSKRKGRILYQSDNYNDCLDKLKIMVAAQKYNL